MDVQIENAFRKNFTFKKDSSWTFSSLEEMVSDVIWQDETLLTFKEELNDVKSTLNTMEPSEWRRHTTNTSIAGRVVTNLQRFVQPELLTQAWCKFWEIINSYEVFNSSVISKSDSFISVHLCEAPGAFITSMNHYMKLYYPSVIWNWMASTLNPYYEGNSTGSTILDDRFIFHTLENWHFGCTNVGDILDVRTISDLKVAVADRPIHFVTADGSIDCQDVPAEQETVVAKLFLAEICTALSLLTQNGCFVCKMFTFFEAQTISLLYILNCTFREVHVFKPVTSKSGNSEVYVVCIGYMGSKFASSIITCLEKHIKNEYFVLNRNAIPKTFLSQVVECAKFFKNTQIETITKNVETFQGMSVEDEQKLKLLKQRCVEKFMKCYKVSEMEDVDKIAPSMSKNGETMLFQYSQKSGNLSFTDRQQLKNSWKRRLGLIRAFAREMFQNIEPCGEFKNTSTIVNSLFDFTPGRVTLGLEVKKINSSLFCPVQLIAALNDLQEYAESCGLSFCSTDNKHLYEKIVSDVCSAKNLNPKYKTEISNQMIVFKSEKERLRPRFIPDELKETFCNVFKSGLLKETDKMFQKTIIACCLNWLYRASPGDCVLLKLNTVHMRFTAGVLFLLASFFKSVSVVQPPKEGLVAQTWCFSDFCPNSNLLMVFDHFWRIFKRLCELEVTEMAVLEIVPLKMLCTNDFYNFVVNYNTSVMLNRVWFFTKKLHFYV